MEQHVAQRVRQTSFILSPMNGSGDLKDDDDDFYEQPRAPEPGRTASLANVLAEVRFRVKRPKRCKPSIYTPDAQRAFVHGALSVIRPDFLVPLYTSRLLLFFHKGVAWAATQGMRCEPRQPVKRRAVSKPIRGYATMPTGHSVSWKAISSNASGA